MKAKVILKRWRARISRARKRGHFTDHDMHDAYDWSKCAVGERDCMCEKVIPSDGYNFSNAQTIREKLQKRVGVLGSTFHTAVIGNHFREALGIIREIESLPKKRFYK